jgi:hypothetical protein
VTKSLVSYMAGIFLGATLLLPLSGITETRAAWFPAAAFATYGQCALSQLAIRGSHTLTAVRCKDATNSGFASFMTPENYHGTLITFKLRVMSESAMPTGSFGVDFSAKCGEIDDYHKIPWGLSTNVSVKLYTQYFMEEAKSLPIIPNGACGKNIPIFWRASVAPESTTEAEHTYVLGVMMEYEEVKKAKAE